jgi:hypothetical protein
VPEVHADITSLLVFVDDAGAKIAAGLEIRGGDDQAVRGIYAGQDFGPDETLISIPLAAVIRVGLMESQFPEVWAALSGLALNSESDVRLAVLVLLIREAEPNHPYILSLPGETDVPIGRELDPLAFGSRLGDRVAKESADLQVSMVQHMRWSRVAALGTRSVATAPDQSTGVTSSVLCHLRRLCSRDCSVISRSLSHSQHNSHSRLRHSPRANAAG